ncbi:magnetosome protein MamR [Magnetovibrio blakemorei]|uniref:MamR-like protein n=1 Tax=Magnetovibrio blakemorei TaxID=28181 RepID=C4RAA7_9PROT|nr:magnetosome protein MamR [Magnetovibrio blakemorei]CAV30752.1 MamR-like protein [Magnetovibrio blakemorei]
MAVFETVGRTGVAVIRPIITILAELADILAGVVLMGTFPLKKKLEPNTIYSTADIAKFLKVERLEVVRLIRCGEINARLVGNNYRIIGQNVLNYLSGSKLSPAQTLTIQASGKEG